MTVPCTRFTCPKPLLALHLPEAPVQSVERLFKDLGLREVVLEDLRDQDTCHFSLRPQRL